MDMVEQNLTSDWKFQLGENEEAWYKGYDDSSWLPVTLPHDWSVMYPFSKGYSSGTGYLPGGTGWYRLAFCLPKSYSGKKVSLCFDGIYKNSQIWFNSYYLGKRPNGYISFSHDISSFIQFGDRTNQICVKVKHEDIADSRWFTGSGMTRKVFLRIEEPLHVREYGSFLVTGKVDGRGAKIAVHHEIVNDSKMKEDFTVRTRLLDEKGCEQFALGERMAMNPGESRAIVLDGKFKQPRLWNIDDPFLYTMVTTIEKQNSSAYIVSTQKTGIRTFRFDPDEGFFLNDTPTLLKGVCVHHDGGCLGAAMHKQVWRRRLMKLKAMGCNGIRCSHNPHMPELYELCDELGFLVMDEAFDEWENPKNKWSVGHNVYPPKHQGYYEDFPQWYEADLLAMVRRDRRHPSVIMWSIGNEIDYPNDPYCHPSFQEMTGNNDNNKPEQERLFSENRPNAERLPILAARLSKIVRDEDPTRPVTLAAAFPELSSKLGFFDSLDVVGYNYKERFYEEDHARFPDKPILGSENGHGWKEWKTVLDKPYISGQFLWTGIDYLGEAHGWPIHGSGAGLLTLAGFEKARYFRRQAMWLDTPAVHLSCLSRNEADQSNLPPEWLPFDDRWDYIRGEMIIVRCDTNQKRGELFLNGKSLGRREEPTELGCFEWEVPFESGKLTVAAMDEKGTVHTEFTISTPGSGREIHLSRWRPYPDSPPSVVEQIEISLTDGEGTAVTGDDTLLSAQLYGEGELLGLENGDLGDNTPYSSHSRSTYKGKLIAYIRRTGSKEIRIWLTGKNGIEASLDL